MSTVNDIAATKGYAHTSLSLGAKPDVRPIDSVPGLFVVDFGLFDLHVTADWWESVDAAVRAGIAAAQDKAAS